MLIFSQFFAICCSILIPLALVIYLGLHYEGKWKLLLFGALTYILFQIALFLPVVSLIANEPSVKAWISGHYALYIILLSLAGAALGELFRYLIIKVFLAHDTSNMDAVAFGLGYGGFETALTVGMNVIISLLASAYIVKAGASMAMLAEGVGQLCLLVMQIGWSLLIMQALRTKKKKFLWICIGLESFFNCISRLGQNVWHWNLWILLIVMIAFGLLMAMYIAQVFKMDQKENK